MLDKIIEKIQKSNKIAIFNHINPDGDAHGSAFGLKLALLELGKQAEVFIRKGDELTKEYKILKGTMKSALEVSDCDLLIAVDCADIGRLGEFSDVFKGNTVAIDHHITHNPFADISLVVPDAPATGEIIFDVVKALGVELTYDIAYNIYLAIVCDTGNFKYSSTTPKTHMVAAELLKTGINFADMTKRLFDSKSLEYLKMYKEGIEKLELYEDGKIAVLSFTEEDFKKAGISEADADGVVNLPNSVADTEVGVYIRQRDDDFKVSLRSNGVLNVAEIATEFGGGGHEKASGFSMDLPLDEVKKKVTERLKIAIDKTTLEK
ncbi:MAG: bifunctional oligoribonuclease/PAP phosphatase NrnA [Clostridia bacterium]|nr:bifunctional oligoribonuclease/PAP phosphatase NrnA [Clostridia bacterium]